MPTIEDPQIARVVVRWINPTALPVTDTITIGDMRFTSIAGPPRGGMKEIRNGDGIWIEQWRYTAEE